MSNLHKELDDDNIHVAKGFSGASNGMSMWRDEKSLQTWEKKNILPSCLKLVESSVVPPTEVDGDIYLIGNQRGILTISTIAWQSVNTIRYSFSGDPDLSTYSAADWIYFYSCVNALNNGDFLITAVNNTSKYIEVSNILIDDATSDETTGGFGTSTLADWDGCHQNSWVRFDVSTGLWKGISPFKSVLCYNEYTSHFMVFSGTVWVQVNITTTGVYDYIILRSTGVDAHRWKFTCDDTGMISMPGEDLGV